MSTSSSFTDSFQESVEEAQSGSQNQTQSEEEAAEAFQESLEEETSDGGDSGGSTSGGDSTSSDSGSSGGGFVDRARSVASDAAETVTSAGQTAANAAGDAVSNLTGDSGGDQPQASSTQQPDDVESTGSEPEASDTGTGGLGNRVGEVADTATDAARDVGRAVGDTVGDAVETAEDVTPANFDASSSEPEATGRRNLNRLEERTPGGRPQPSDRQQGNLERLERQTADAQAPTGAEEQQPAISDQGLGAPAASSPLAGLGTESDADIQQPDRVEMAGEAVENVDRQISDTVGRGSPASETARDVAATGLDLVFQDPQEIIDSAESATGVETGLDVRDRTGGIAISGPSATFQPGQQGELNREVTDSLTQGRGLFPTSGDPGGFFSETEETLRQTAEQRQEFFGVGEEAADVAPDVSVFGADLEPLAGGVGSLPGEAAAGPSSILLAADTAVEVGANTPRTVQEFGAGETAEASLEVGGRTTEQGIEAARENPERVAGQLGGALLGGFAAGRAIQSAPNLARSASIRARGGRIVDFDDVSNPPRTTEGLDLPGYSRRAQADPDVAAREFREQASENALAGDDPVAFHVRAAEDVADYGGFGRDFEAPGGSSEIGGLFQSADLSPLRLPGGGGRGISVGLPRPSVRQSRVLAERDVDVDVAEGRTTSEVGDFIEDADTSQSYVRGGDVTPEQEVIAPPGSRFLDEGDGVFGVRVGGRRIPGTDRRVGGDIVTGRTVRRADGDTDVDLDADGATTRTGAEVASETTDAIEETVRRRQVQPSAPFVPVGAPTPGGVSDGTRSGGEVRSRTTAPPTAGGTTPASGGSGDDSTGGGGTSSSPPGGSETPPASPPILLPPTGGGPIAPPTGGPTTSPPSSPPGSPPTTGGGGGAPPATPPSSPPSGGGSPPTPPTEPPQRQRRRSGDDGDPDEDEEFGTLLGDREEVFTDFVDPLTGEVLTTEEDNI